MSSQIEDPIAPVLNEAVWEAWQRKGRLRQERNDARRVKALHWVALAGLICAAAAIWSREIAAFDVAIRFLVFGGALALMIQTLGARRYVYAAAFGALAVLYNPVQPTFQFSGNWEPSLIAASAIPFVISLTTPQRKVAAHV
jgi:hypothetical protein